MNQPLENRLFLTGDAPPRSILIVGPEGGRLSDWVFERASRTADWAEQATGVQEASRLLTAEQTAPDLILLVQERPGQLPAETPAKLKAAAPDAALLSVAGSWCEGELRTGKPWEEVERIYWHGLDAWLSRWAGGIALPVHAGCFLAVEAVHQDSADSLIEGLADLGHSVVWLPRRGPKPLVAGIEAALWLGDQLDGHHAEQLADFCRQMRACSAPVVALLDFPRLDEARLAEEIGVAAVLGKPWQWEDLSQLLLSVTATSAEVAARRRLAA